MPDNLTIRAPTDIAKKVGERQDGSPIYQAGPDAKGYKTGQIVSQEYAENARRSRRAWNVARQIKANQNTDWDTAWQQHRNILNELDDAETEERRREIWQQYAY